MGMPPFEAWYEGFTGTLANTNPDIETPTKADVKHYFDRGEEPAQAAAEYAISVEDDEEE